MYNKKLFFHLAYNIYMLFQVVTLNQKIMKERLQGVWQKIGITKRPQKNVGKRRKGLVKLGRTMSPGP